MGSEHTAKAFDSDLQELTRLVAEMGGLAERMITESVDALVRRDVALGTHVVTSDVEIDRLQHLIEERAVLTIARRQPMAIDLREIVGAMRVATDLERIGDLAKNMGKRVAALENDFQPLKLIRGLEHMTDLVQSQVKSVLDAYAAHDLPAAMAVWKGDEEALTTLLRYNLDAEGYEVETVGRGDDADTRLKERVPDLIVLDWMLPGLSGIELCRRLRARPETKQLPIIMLTARGEESERVRGLATGADD